LGKLRMRTLGKLRMRTLGKLRMLRTQRSGFATQDGLAATWIGDQHVHSYSSVLSPSQKVRRQTSMFWNGKYLGRSCVV
jgi:hypothetical protein